MYFLILLFAILILLAGSVLTIKPKVFLDFVSKNSQAAWLHAAAVLVRLILGLALVAYADATRFPLVISILGWLTVIAAIILAAMGRTRFVNFIKWVIGRVSPYVRGAGVFALLFGGFLIYAIV